MAKVWEFSDCEASNPAFVRTKKVDRSGILLELISDRSIFGYTAKVSG